MNIQLSLVSIIVLVTVAISVYVFTRPDWQERLMLNPYRISRKGEWYRFVTSGLIHQGWVHLLFNMFTFYFFGRWMEHYFVIVYGKTLGYLLFLLLYVGGIIVADIPTYFKYKNTPYYNSLGASGGVSAVIFATIFYNPTEEVCLYAFFCLPGFVWGGIYLAYSYFYDQRGADNINHSAHFYGALYGFLLAFLIRPAAIQHFIDAVMHWSLF
ncbi:MAG: rhomboid family intramembrane serine protease [Cytophagales bacterium]|nr:rhomboid family intramembrane serine protease [Bernardetiaceae bacterium]MDW8203700.1 rhomboid family intramembrane serine protease [Cytophagales bacterium]